MIRRMTDFRVETEQIDLPSGAFCKSRRHYVRWRGRAILGLSTNAFRAYLFPVYTPAGLPLTEEAPIDHPHHQSVWLGADHVDCLLPYGEGQVEVANYNFYVQETFQGRAAGRMIERAIDWDELAERHLRVVQEIEWRGPAEWGAPEGRIVAHESRAIDVQPGEMAHVIDVRSRLRPGTCDLQIGPTRHAYFGIRLVEPLRPDGSAALVDAQGRSGVAAIDGTDSDWIHIAGQLTRDHQAGMACFPYPQSAAATWGVHPWGTIDINPLRRESCVLAVGQHVEYGMRLVAHDGPLAAAQVTGFYRDFCEIPVGDWNDLPEPL